MSKSHSSQPVRFSSWLLMVPTTKQLFTALGARSRRQWTGIIGFCLVITYFLMSSDWYDPNDLSIALGRLNTQPANGEPGLRGYVYDDDNNFVVLQKHINHMFANKENRTHHFWQAINCKFTKKINYDIHILEDYDYNKFLRTKENQYVEAMSSPDSERLTYNLKFKEELKKFFELIQKLVNRCKPSISTINDDDHYPRRRGRDNMKYEEREGRIPVYGGHLRENFKEDPIRSKEYLGSFLQLSFDEKYHLENSHKCYMENLMDDFPQELYKYSKYNDFMKGDGIVYLGGTKYYQLVLLLIKTLRDMGSMLPVEVLIPSKEEYDYTFCNDIFPNFNAQCKIMNEYMPDSMIKTVTGFQLKNIAILISSFQRILYLDLDNLPLRNVDSYFVNPPFTDSKMVIWPDMWRRSTLPDFYSIAGIQVDAKNRTRNSYFAHDPKGTGEINSFHDCDGTIPEASLETGQLIIDKKVHIKTLLLSMYYNFYGPEYFYPLLSQGAAGEGDKETFVAAAHKLGLPYYQVQEFTREFGPHNDWNTRQYFAMGQYDPIIDYIQSSHDNIDRNVDFETRLKDFNNNVAHINYFSSTRPVFATNEKDHTKNNYKYHLYRSLQLAFLHANWPKLKAKEFFVDNAKGRGPVEGSRRRRIYTKDLLNELGGYDFELHTMENLHWIHCELNLKLWTDEKEQKYNENDAKKICEQLKEELLFLRGPILDQY